MKIFGYRVVFSKFAIEIFNTIIYLIAVLSGIFGCALSMSVLSIHLETGDSLNIPVFVFIAMWFVLPGIVIRKRLIYFFKNNITIEKAKRDEHDLEQIEE